jgi:HK97 gp10 family phage protein
MSLKAVIQFINKTDDVEKGVGKFVNVAVQKSLLVMERNIKVNTPVQEGHLRRSISNRMIDFFNGEVFTNPVSGNVETKYALFVEFGTKFMAPRAMFRKGAAQSQEKIQEIFKDEAENVLSEVRGV